MFLAYKLNPYSHAI
ncbi:hypothetical protein CGLO_12155 [Colletotrichum gloeosporioides Cg-14]|uniref:Uncharacterized protein n=1 Tax=Colletotrichum gloeosporioides (strain Cg-14) TaxID=1237896 RepID=T0K6K3_COLGC|nr:hypothetical protein CGLO_12155 [Colletotrichum gloeosporioides Cg-14]